MPAVGVVLPDELAYVLDLIGVSWPNVDEDDYREMATSLRDFASDIDGGAMDANAAVQELLGANAGAAMDAFEAHWGRVKGTHLANLGEAARMGALALDGVAIAIEVAKGAAIVQLGILAVEIASAIASAPFTLGLSSLAGAAGTQATRMIVKKIFREVIDQVVDQLMSIATAPVYAALESMAADLVIQVGSNALGLQKGVDLGRTVGAGKEGFGEGVDGAKKQADGFVLASAGGGGGGGGTGEGGSGGGTGGSGHFQSDGDSFDRVDSRLDGITGSLHGKSRGHMSRARNAKGRTTGGGEIAAHIMPIATKIVDGIGEAAEKAVGHVRGDMRKGLKEMHRNHRDNDDRTATELDGLHKLHSQEQLRSFGDSTDVYHMADDGTITRLTADGHIPLTEADRDRIALRLDGKDSVGRRPKGKYKLPELEKGKTRPRKDSAEVPLGGSPLAKATQLARHADNSYGNYYKKSKDSDEKVFQSNNYAAVRYGNEGDDDGFILVGRSRNPVHSERALGIPFLRNDSHDGITELYTEREPCSTGVNCSAWMHHYLPDSVNVSHSVEYGDTPESQVRGNSAMESYLNGLQQLR
ncbi:MULTISPECIES: nucleic acid/nucleotide deaminase domain-containing protein [unclassified Streptomyces]|uniref:WXG100-like domain-containing protein n=1 Tax=unclassified Streptomyces TaxID=2593676 RepID=UPI003815F48A